MDILWQRQIKFGTECPFINALHVKREKKDVKNQKKFKWSTALDNLPHFDHAKAIPFPNLSSVDFSNIKGKLKSLSRSETGSQGVYFLDMEGGAIVLKPPSHSLASEAFCSLLCLELGLRIPKFRLFRSHSDQGQEMFNELRKIDPSHAVVIGLYDQKYLMMKEYCPGNDLQHPGMLKQIHARDNYNLEKQLGMMLCLDVFLNNSDRLPLLWQNQGNAGNLFLAWCPDLELVFMDTQIRCLDIQQEAFQIYSNHVQQLFKTVIKKPKNIPTPFKTCFDVLAMWTENYWKIETTEQIEAVYDGFLDLLHRIQKLELSWFQQVYSDIQSLEEDEENQKLLMTSIQLDYIEAMLNLFKSL